MLDQLSPHPSKAAFIQFSGPRNNSNSRSQRKRGENQIIRRGHFVDCKTLSSALFAKSFSLQTLCDALSVENGKIDYNNFDTPICKEFIDYAVRDTQATWECYTALIEKYEKLGLNNTPPEKIYSEASIGKACLKSIGVKPWRECQGDFNPQIIGIIMSAYYGGRSEIGIRRQHRQVMLCDFLSMYPTVCTLMQLWPFVIATGIKQRDAMAEAKAILDTITLEQLQSKDLWQKLTILVRVKPDADIFPVRAHYGDAAQATIGLNYLTGDKAQWFTLADCIASKLLSGKTPEIIKAIGFAPMAKQSALSSIDINGNPEYAIYPAKNDFYKRLIELRQSVKDKRKHATCDVKALLDTEQNALKITANASSYGIFIENNVENAEGGIVSSVYNGRDDAFTVQVSKQEKPGSFFHPVLATLITGAARLMLALTEKLATNRGLQWAFCDTDSMALAKPDLMDSINFAAKVHEIIDWFSELNPYDFGGSILKSEDVNYSLSGDGILQPLYCFAVSSKRYALYNMDAKGNPVIRKASAHGLGHLRPPYDERNPAKDILKPQIDLEKSQLALWQHDLWYVIIKAGLSDTPMKVVYNYHPALMQPAISRYAATSPNMLRWFNDFNKGRDYQDQVKPFGFLTPMPIDPFDTSVEFITCPQRRLKAQHPIKPVSPFETDPAIAGANAFDRITGLPVPKDRLKTYQSALAQYHLQPENKLLNGDYDESGPTQQRHVKAVGAWHIGKEANGWERQVVLGYDPTAQPAYGMSPDDIAAMQIELKRLCRVFSKSKIAEFAKVTVMQIVRFVDAEINSEIEITNGTLADMQRAIGHFQEFKKKKFIEKEKLKAKVAKYGLRAMAGKIGVDPSICVAKLAT